MIRRGRRQASYASIDRSRRGAVERSRRGAGRWLAAVLLLVSLGACTARRDELPLPYRQAEDAFRLGDYDRSAAAYKAYLRVAEEDDLIPKAYYKLALSEFRRGRYAECLAVLDELDAELPGQRWVRVYELRADAEQARGNIVSAIRWWEMAWVEADGDRRIEIQRRIRHAIAELPPSSLKAARSVVETEEIRALFDAQSRSGGPPRDVGTSTPSGGRGTASLPPDAGVPPPSATNLKIGVLLPLTGPYAVYGKRSLNGIRLALDRDADRLVVRDTQGQPQIARSALDELIGDRNVVAVLGPLRSKEAEVVAVRAESSGMPLFLLSQREVGAGRFLLQPVMTYERQASELAEYATVVMGLKSVGVLYPRDEYGSGLADAFERELERRGGRVVGVLAYEPGAKEFPVEGLTVQKWMSDDGLQAVFIPDFAATAVELGRLLRTAHPTLTLLGSNGWNDPARLGTASQELDGAVFVDGFFPASTRPATQAFVSAYQSAYGGEPEILEAQAHDAAMMLRRAIEAGARSRTQVGPALASLRTFDGAAGTVGISPDGMQRELFLLRLARGAINEIAPLAAPGRSAPARSAAQAEDLPP